MDINRIAMLGNKDHGKSTLIGSLMLATHSASEARIKDAKEASKKIGVKFEPAFLLDSFYEEREGGLTIDTTRAQLRYKNKAFEFIDVPGHEELIKNMISGASYASAAILLVSAKNGEAISPQTKRHVYLANMLGIKKLVVAINKMDTVNYEKSKFDSLVKELDIEKLGYSNDNVAFVPISAYNNKNLISKAKEMKWYKGKPLLEELMALLKNKKQDRPEGMVALLQGSIELGSKKGIAAKVINGKMQKGSYFYAFEKDERYKIEELYAKGKQADVAKEGQNVIIYGKNLPDSGVIFEKESMIKPLKEVKARIFAVEDLPMPISIKIYGNAVKCNAMKIERIMDFEGKKSNGKNVKALEGADVVFSLKEPIAAMPFDIMPELGRLVIYKGDKFAGIGIVTQS